LVSAADSDKKNCQEDSAAFLETCREIGVFAALSAPVPAMEVTFGFYYFTSYGLW